LVTKNFLLLNVPTAISLEPPRGHSAGSPFTISVRDQLPFLPSE
jgi:hypothetical protein